MTKVLETALDQLSQIDSGIDYLTREIEKKNAIIATLVSSSDEMAAEMSRLALINEELVAVLRRCYGTFKMEDLDTPLSMEVEELLGKERAS